MWRHREDLMRRLDHVLGQLDLGIGYIDGYLDLPESAYFRCTIAGYEKLKDTLLEVDREAMETLTKSHSTFGCALPLPCP